MNDPSVRSEPGLDLYRGGIVLLMFAVHARRLESPVHPPAGIAELADRALDGALFIEPYVAASFLFLAGFSLVLSHQKNAENFRRKVARRTLVLWALSVAMFVPQYGLTLPDLVLSSGILSAIALSILLVGATLGLHRPKLWLGLIIGAVIAITAWLDGSGRTVSGLNAGPGGAFPLVAFCATGAFLALIHGERGIRALSGFALGAIAPSLVAAFAELPWVTERTSRYSHPGLTAVADVVHGRPGVPSEVAFWNHSAIGAVGLMAPLCITLLLVLGTQRRLARRAALAPVSLLGRHALAAYVLHLGLLGVVDLCGLDPKGPLETLGLVFVLALASWLFARARERLIAKHSFGPARV